MHWLRNNSTWLSFIAVVIIPLLFIAFYLFTIAENRYVSTSTVVVKQIGDIGGSQTNGLGILLGVNNTSSEDAHFLKAYIQSPDLIYALDKQLNLRKAFAGNGGDPIFELSSNASKEDLVKYFNRRVTLTFDEKNSMLTVKTEGFTPQFALKLNQAILKLSESFINQISQRVARDQLVFAQTQLEEAASNLKQSRENLIAYQNRNQMLDPQTTALATSRLVMQLQSQLADLQTQERTLLSYLNPEAPQVVALHSQINAVQQQIAQEQGKLTSPQGSTKLNRRSADFEELKAKVEFSTDLYKLALGSLEKARLEAVRKLKNVVIITSPQLAQDAYYPRKGYILLSSFLIFTIIFGIGQLVASIIREHRE